MYEHGKNPKQIQATADRKKRNYQVPGQNLLPSTQFNGERWVFYPNAGCLFFLIVLFSFKTLLKTIHEVFLAASLQLTEARKMGCEPIPAWV